MDAYIDLSIIVFLFNFILSFIYSMIIFDSIKYKIHFIIQTILIAFLALIINLLYIPYFFIMILVLYSLFVSIFNLKLLKSLLSTLLIFYINYGFLLLIGGCYLYEGILLINIPFITLFILIIPIYITLVHLFFNALIKQIKYRKFKIKCLIKVNEKVYKGFGYYDSGNSLLYDDIPVIFIKGKSLSNDGKVIYIKGINDYEFKYLAYKAILKIKNKEMTVYVVYSNSNVNFYNCQFLLNKYIY